MDTWKKLSLSDKAEGDFVSIVSAYQTVRPSLGARFYREVIDSLEQIRQFPKGHPPFHDHYRYLIMRNFPYFLIYLELQDKIIVDAIAHAHQKRDNMLSN